MNYIKRTIFCFALLGMGAQLVQAQPINRATPEAMKASAEEAESTNNPYAALELYDEINKTQKGKDNTIAAKIAKLEYDVRDYGAAEKAFSRLVTRDRTGEFTELKYWYAMSLKANGKYQEATEAFNQYIAEGSDTQLKAAAKNEIAGCEMARKAKTNSSLLIANGGKKINSPQTEGSPDYSGNELYFASIQQKGVITLDGKEGDWHSKIFTATKAGAEFGEPVALDVEINREGFHQGNVSISADGNTMFFTRVELENQGISTSKIYYSRKSGNGWGAAQELGGVNGEYAAKHPCEGELFGEKVLFFVANIPGGKGGDDIYYATRKSDGVYGAPVNVGGLNTIGDEVTPFYLDGKLFFSSNGYPTLGGMDVFSSQWNGAVWSAPANLGLGINSSLDDQYYTQSPDGYSGFFVSNRPGPNNLKSKTCCDDIYSWEIERVKVELEANVFRKKRKDEKEKQPLNESTVQIFDVTDKNPANVDQKSSAVTHKYDFVLSPERSYRIIATHDGYIPDTLDFNTVGVKKSTKITKDLLLGLVKKVPQFDTIRTNEAIRLDNILYDYDKWDIRPDAEPDLQYLTDILLKYPEMTIELSSHTDSRGRKEYNETLSQKRAESAKNWVVSKGIKAERIIAKGYGENVLLNRCADGVECSEDEHQLNRRTEFKILSGPTSIVIERIEQRQPKKPTGNNGGKQSLRPVFFYQH
jgi:peptidoglycan-associated lipoprotein